MRSYAMFAIPFLLADIIPIGTPSHPHTELEFAGWLPTVSRYDFSFSFLCFSFFNHLRYPVALFGYDGDFSIYSNLFFFHSIFFFFSLLGFVSRSCPCYVQPRYVTCLTSGVSPTSSIKYQVSRAQVFFFFSSFPATLSLGGWEAIYVWWQ